ncbi:MAG: type IV conjugative transfer system protein TraL [Thermoplasmata archaeon]
MADQSKRFPKYLASPVQILWWESDVFFIFLLFAFMGLVFKGIWWALAVVMPYIYNKIKVNYSRGFLKHLFYFIGFMDFKHYPSFFHNHFFE